MPPARLAFIYKRAFVLRNKKSFMPAQNTQNDQWQYDSYSERLCYNDAGKCSSGLAPPDKTG
jgi:hypothetical protein